MKPAADVMSEKIRSTNFNKPDLDIICNVTAKSENNPDKIKKAFSRPNLLFSKMERKKLN